MTERQEQIKISRHLLGKKIKEIELNEHEDSRGIIFDPVIVFTDGTRLSFNVTESEESGYGVSFFIPKFSLVFSKK